MASPIHNSDPTRRPRNSLIAAGLLVAVGSVLIGFHGTTMVLALVSPVEQEQSKAASKDPRVPEGDPKATHGVTDPSVDRQTRADESSAKPPPTGIAAAAKAKALAEMDAMEPRELEAQQQQEERPRRTPRRIHRVPRVDKHKVY
jgi:hypothetical protein